MIENAPFPPRAGFWRRIGAGAIDVVLVGIVVAVLGTLTFALSGGRVQTRSFGFDYSSCTNSDTVPPDLTPSPPEGSNYSSECEAGPLPGAVSARYLVVGRKISSPGRVETVFRSYALSAAGAPIDDIDLTWVGQLGFVAYLAVCLVLRGRTLGMQVLRSRLVMQADPYRAGIPLRRLLLRVAVAVGGLVPALLLAILAAGWSKIDPESAPVALLVVLILIAISAWLIYNAVLIVRKTDPVYDRVAKLAVIVG